MSSYQTSDVKDPPVADSSVGKTALKGDRKKYHLLFENMVTGVAYCRMLFKDGRPDDYIYLAVNKTFEKLTGLKDVGGKRVTEVFAGIKEMHPQLFEAYGRVVVTGRSETFEIFLKPLQIWLSITAYSPEKGHFVALCSNITQQKIIEADQKCRIELLQMCAQASSLRNLIHTLTVFFQTLTGCEAVAMRWKQGNDFPYYETIGFPLSFVLAERKLCHRDKEGQVVFDQHGKPVLECMCGCVLRGHVDRQKPSFTTYGSFWTNSTSELSGSIVKKDRPQQSRNRCVNEGYESVALIPIRFGKENVGLFQFNDKRKGLFTSERISFYESLIEHASIVLAKLSKEEDLKLSEARYRLLSDNIADVISILDLDTMCIKYISPSVKKVVGYSAKEIVNRDISFLLAPQTTRFIASVLPARLAEFNQGITRDYVDVTEQIRADGTPLWTESTTRLFRNQDNGHLEVFCVSRDITERKAAEEKASKAHEDFERFFSNIPYLACIGSTNGYFKRLNPAWEKTLGYTLEELLSRPFLDFIHPDDIETTKKEIERQVNGGRTMCFVNRYRCKDGSYKFLEWWSTPAKGGVLFAAALDITERRQTEDRLKASEERYRGLFEAESDAILFSECKTNRFLDINSAAIELYGYSREEFLQMRTFDISAEPYKTRKAIEEYQQSIPLRWHRKKDGTVFPVEITSNFFDYQGRKVQVAAIRNITERMQAQQNLQEQEAKLSALFNILPVGVAIVDLDRRIVDCNPALERIMGLSKQDLLDGKNMQMQYLREDGRPLPREDIPSVRVFHERCEIRDVRIGIFKDDASTKWLSVNAAPLPGIGAALASVDITARKEAEVKLKEQQRRLEASERKLRNFTQRILSIREDEKKKISADLHDEIGSMAVAFNSQLTVAEKQLDERNYRGVREAVETSRALLKEEVRIFKKIAADLRPPNLQVVGLIGALKGYFNDVRKHQNIQIEFTVDPPRMTFNDEAAITLYRITQESINNILKHSGAAKAFVKLFKGNGQIFLSVCDEGRGFDLVKVMNNMSGNQLGIIGIKERVEFLGGILDIKTAANKGTEIRVTLPLKQRAK